MLLSGSSALFAQQYFTLDMEDANHGPVEGGINGGHLSDFFENCFCYDPMEPGGGVDSIDLCMQLFGNLQHQTVRFPSGGNNKYMHPYLGPGYGYKESDIISMLDDGSIGIGEAMTYFDAIEKQATYPDSIRFLDRLVDLVWYADTVYGRRPGVIYVAGLTLSKRLPDQYNVVDENMAVLKYLDSMGIEIAGVEMGQEHFRDSELFSDFEDYYEHCLPLINAIRAEPSLAGIKIALVGALEPDVNAMYELGNVNVSKNWNAALRYKADNDTLQLFDAYTLHIYYKAPYHVDCFLDYTNNYYAVNPNYPIDFSTPDPILHPIWKRGMDSIRKFTEEILPYMFERYSANDSVYCLGNKKEYWITEWGMKPPKDDKLEYDGLLLQGSMNNTFIDAAHTLQYILALNDINAHGDARITRVTKHATNAGFVFGSYGHRSKNLDPLDSTFLRRANYYALELVRPVFNNNFRPMDATVYCLDNDTVAISCIPEERPYIRTYIDATGSSFSTEGIVCSDGDTSTSIQPWWWMYWVNPTPDTLELITERLKLQLEPGEPSFVPVWGKVAYQTTLQVEQLYSHCGQNAYMMDNAYYDDMYIEPLMVDPVTTELLICNDAPILLPPYSMGHLRAALYQPEEEEPKPNSIAAEENAIRVYPNPASELLQVEHIPANGRFSMVNTEGKEVITRQGMKGNEQISISHLPAGAYIVTIYEQTAVVYRTTVVVQ